MEQLCIKNNITVEPVYYGHLGTNKKCPDFPGQLYDKALFGTTTKFVDYTAVLIFKSPD